MKLSELPAKSEAAIIGFAKDFEVSHARRLREIGFYENNTVYCLRRTPFQGPLVFRVGNAIFSIGKDVASKILVHSLQGS